MARTYTVNNAGNLDDVRNSIRCGWDKMTLQDLNAALRDESKSRKRKSFIALLEASIKRKKAELKRANSIVRVIHFEDHQQDFLEWHLDSDGRVVESRPFQTDLWKKYTVINHDWVRPGDHVQITKSGGRKIIIIRYLVEKVEEVHNG